MIHTNRIRCPFDVTEAIRFALIGIGIAVQAGIASPAGILNIRDQWRRGGWQNTRHPCHSESH